MADFIKLPKHRPEADAGPVTRTYTVVAGKYEWDEEAGDYVENIKVLKPDLDAATAKAEYYICRGYAFSRIEDDEGNDVSAQLYGIEEGKGNA